LPASDHRLTIRRAADPSSTGTVEGLMRITFR